MLYCTYLTIYSGDKLPRRYIGSSSVRKVQNGYNGSVKSGYYKPIYDLEQKINKHLFKTRILSYHETFLEAATREKEIQLKYQAHKSQLYYNMAVAAPNGCFGRDVAGEKHPMFGKHHSESSRKRISESNRLAYEEGRAVSPFSAMDFNGESNPFFGRKHSEETKKQMSESRAEYFANGGVSSTLGKPVPEERKKRIGETYKRRRTEGSIKTPRYLRGEEHPNFGKETSEEIRNKLRKPKDPSTWKTCPHCERSIGPGPYGRFHGDKCKDRLI
ncbi:putative homing endonuclease protein [Rhizobium phage RHph_I46]|uniref:Putative homing endonuclease protein n=1 Tax=Rhizobium phage RHph_I1_9 TaxID=2509729 RepID=A0A7S5R9S1_9CAUD|nr:HNH endonuclease [Rhizobium phage RHph_I1_9]QIG69706.1 putative homing endonuclease protein [Rhizobium phage RHph_I46]QIG70987.1 putative homing endonuclease protein [Rhizobium phage RHph_I9]QIG73573.1 putative homing endonuclease protein [Rhizobium phage RHph_I1_9]QIG76326.1 putative homing endonuclease protein [Rhizobium phage RHph_I34]